MFSGFARLLLAATAMAPVGLTYAWVAYSAGNIAAALGILSVCSLLFAICDYLLGYAQKHLEKSNFTVASVEPADNEVIASILLYIFPLFTEQFSALNWGMWLPALAVFVVVIGTGCVFHFNPLLSIRGWHFFKVSTNEGITYLLITKKRLRNVTKQITIGQLTDYIVMDLGGKQ